MDTAANAATKILKSASDEMRKTLDSCRRKGMSARDTKDIVCATGTMALGLSPIGPQLGMPRIRAMVDAFYKGISKAKSPAKRKTSAKRKTEARGK